MNVISTCLWFDNQAEEAANFYTTVFENGKVGKIVRYGKAAASMSGQQENAVMTVLPGTEPTRPLSTAPSL